ncbi:MAG: hypothetical protein H6755_01545 [Candidatus Omnitrophica bacterium]|nr:hypothetical protein [Candidatus Omnitrophota bacterium]MCB9747076.1 hypothetical protein [Candidatus Omnitrophota bacterium]
MFTYFNNRRKKGQSTLEYVILVIIIIGALLSIQVYIKRGVQGRLKGATDDIGDQFDPGNTNYNMTTTTSGRTRQEQSQALGQAQTFLTDEVTTDLLNSTIINSQQTFWGN